MDAIKRIAAGGVLGLAAATAAAEIDGALPPAGDHPAVIVKRLEAGKGYDYLSKFYPHPAWLYLRATPRAQSPEAELKRLYLQCDRAAMRGPLDAGAAAACSTAYETLKRDVFGGDFHRLLAWSRTAKAAPQPSPREHHVR